MRFAFLLLSLSLALVPACGGSGSRASATSDISTIVATPPSKPDGIKWSEVRSSSNKPSELFAGDMERRGFFYAPGLPGGVLAAPLSNVLEAAASDYTSTQAPGYPGRYRAQAIAMRFKDAASAGVASRRFQEILHRRVGSKRQLDASGLGASAWGLRIFEEGSDSTSSVAFGWRNGKTAFITGMHDTNDDIDPDAARAFADEVAEKAG